jgi:hypothetical protein
MAARRILVLHGFADALIVEQIGPEMSASVPKPPERSSSAAASSPWLESGSPLEPVWSGAYLLHLQTISNHWRTMVTGQKAEKPPPAHRKPSKKRVFWQKMHLFLAKTQ